jgi:type II secretory pathway component PulJ
MIALVIIGAFLLLLAYSLCHAASVADDQMEEYYRREKHDDR